MNRHYRYHDGTYCGVTQVVTQVDVILKEDNSVKIYLDSLWPGTIFNVEFLGEYNMISNNFIIFSLSTVKINGEFYNLLESVDDNIRMELIVVAHEEKYEKFKKDESYYHADLGYGNYFDAILVMTEMNQFYKFIEKVGLFSGKEDKISNTGSRKTFPLADLKRILSIIDKKTLHLVDTE